MKVEVEQRIALVTLVLVLLSEPDDLLQDLDVEALTLGLGKNILLLVIYRFELLVDMLDTLDERAKPIARNPIWSTHGLLLSARKHLGEKSRRGSPPNRGFIENRTRHAAWPGSDARYVGLRNGSPPGGRSYRK